MTGRALALSLLSRRRYCCVDMNRPWGGFLLIIAGLLLPLTIPAAMVAVPYALEIAISGAVGCENRTVAEYFSPDASMKVMVFERNCGATTPFSTQASILRGSSRLANIAGNTFIADRDHGRARATTWGGPTLNVLWLDAHRVVLFHDERARIFLAEERVSGVDVFYNRVP